MEHTYVASDAVEIKTIKLSSLNGKKSYDLRKQVTSFSIYEDLLFPVVRAEFLLVDALDLLNTFPIIGEETIEIEFANPGFDRTCNYTFHVKSVENQINSPQGKSKSYIIRAYSEEFIQNLHQVVSEKKQGSPETIVTNILKNNLKTEKQIFVGDPTKGTLEITFTNNRPFQVIDFIRKSSVSGKYKSSSYVLYENNRGFNFCTIEYLMDKQQGVIKDKQFFFDTAGKIDPKNMNTRTLMSLVNTSQFDNTKKISQGSLNNDVRRFDLLTGKVALTNYKNSEKQKEFKFGSKHPLPLNTSSYENQYGSDAATKMFIPHSSDLPENYIDAAMGYKHSFVTKIAQNTFQAYINGDVAMSVGDLITINIPAATGATDNPGDNRLISGNYLISKLRHIVLNGVKSSYTMSVELIKGSYEDRA